jgi:rod shape determining protein RodA
VDNNVSLRRSIDWWLIFYYLLLIFIGWFTIFASQYESGKRFIDFSQDYGRQLIWIGMGAVLGFFILLTDSKAYTTFAYFIYGAVMFLLIAVLFVGEKVNGSRSWFSIAGFQLQPAEFAKLAANIALAKFLSGLHINIKDFKTQLIAIGIFAFPAALIVLQGDAGSALVFLMFFLVLYRFGQSPVFLLLGTFVLVISIFSLIVNKYMLSAAVIIVATIIISGLKRKREIAWITGIVAFLCVGYIFTANYVFNHVLEEHQRTRVDVLLGKQVTIKDADYNVREAKIAIGSGGLFGKGFLQGTLTKYDFVPEQHTDFIFCTIGEEFGFAGSAVLLLTYLLLLLRILFIADRQRSSFSRIYGYGVASIIFFHVIINVGMTIGFIPVIGIPLPFISYGGSSFLSFTILLFILIKLDSDRLAVLR